MSPSSLVIPLLEFTYGPIDFKVQESGELLSFTHEESVYSTGVYSMKLRTYDMNRWDRLINAEAREEGTLRWGGAAPANELWSDIRKVRCNEAEFYMDNHGVLTVEAAGTCAGFQRLWSCRQLAFKDKTVSQIVTKIAELNDLTPSVAGTKYKTHAYQCGLSDWTFIKDHLRPQAVAGDDRTDFYFYVDKGDTLVFKPPDLKKAPRHKFVLSYNPQGNSEVLSFRVSYREHDQKIVGSRHSVCYGFHPIEKQVIIGDANEFSNFNYPVLADAFPDVPPLPTKVYSTVLPEGEDFVDDTVRDYANANWGKYARGMYRIELTTMPIFDINLADVIDLEVRDFAGKTHFLSGKYLVHKVKQVMSASRWNTIVGLERRGHQ